MPLQRFLAVVVPQSPDHDHGSLQDFKRPSHTWHEPERTSLCLLHKLYDNTFKEYTQILNRIYQRELQREGFISGLPTTTVNTQWHDMHRPGKGAIIVKSVQRLSLSEARTNFPEIREQLEHAAAQESIILRLRPYDHQVDHKRGRPRVRKSKEPQGVLGDEFSEDAASPRPSKYRKRSIPKTDIFSRRTPSTEDRTQALTPASTQSTQSTPGRKGPYSSAIRFHTSDSAVDNRDFQPFHRKMPRLAYRFFDNTSNGFNSVCSGFRAGMALDLATTMSPPPDVNDSKMRELASIHLNGVPLPTPFISVRESPLPAIYKALSSQDDDAAVVVIDLFKVEQSLKAAFPDASETVYMTPWLVKRLGLNLPGNYVGFTEWCVWGWIPPEACIAYLRASDLRRFVREFTDSASILQFDVIEEASKAAGLGIKLKNRSPETDARSGYAVGEFLSTWSGQAPLEYVEEITSKIARAWKFQSRQGLDFEFMEAVFSGLHERKKSTVVSLYREGEWENVLHVPTAGLPQRSDSSTRIINSQCRLLATPADQDDALGEAHAVTLSQLPVRNTKYSRTQDELSEGDDKKGFQQLVHFASQYLPDMLEEDNISKVITGNEANESRDDDKGGDGENKRTGYEADQDDGEDDGEGTQDWVIVKREDEHFNNDTEPNDAEAITDWVDIGAEPRPASETSWPPWTGM